MDLMTYALCKKNDFLVTLTPIHADLSGTMDKTPQEIFNAVSEGKKIVFDIPAMNASVIPQQYLRDGSGGYVVAGQVVYDVSGVGSCLIHIATQTNDSLYSTEIFQLTKVS